MRDAGSGTFHPGASLAGEEGPWRGVRNAGVAGMCRVAGGQLSWVLGTLGKVRFFVEVKSLQSELPGDSLGKGHSPHSLGVSIQS